MDCLSPLALPLFPFQRQVRVAGLIFAATTALAARMPVSRDEGLPALSDDIYTAHYAERAGRLRGYFVIILL